MSMNNESVWDFVEFVERAKKDPNLLEDVNLPSEFVKLVKPLIQTDNAKGKDINDLETEISDLYKEVNEFKPGSLDDDRDAQQQYLKLKAALIGKLVDLKERTWNLRTLKNFQDRVLLAIDKVMSAEQRTEFMKILGEQ
jgi:hypothetical protein